MTDADSHAPEAVPDPRGAAVIVPVTDEAMQHAAHAAAELAEGVARGTVRLERPDRDAAAPEPAEAVGAVDARHAAEIGSDAVERDAHEAAAPVFAAAEAASPSASDALGRYGTKLLEILRVNVEAAGAHAAALAQAKSLPEAAQINADHVRRRLEAATGQGRELSILAQRALFEALQPFKGVRPRD